MPNQPSLIVVGITCRTSNAPDAGPRDIPMLWQRLYEENVPPRIPHRISDDVIALYYNYEGDHTKPYSVLIGCPVAKVDNLPEGFTAEVIPEAKYQVFPAIGQHPKSLIETWGKIWQTPLQRAYTFDYELYGKKFALSPQQVDVFIALH